MFDIKKALSFYGITEPYYAENIENVANTVENNPEYLSVYEKFSGIMFGLHHEERAKYHQTNDKQELFGFDIPYFTNLILLSGYEYHDKYMKENLYDEEQITAQKNRLNAILHTGDKVNGISVVQLFWGSNFTNGEIIEIGRLQYENKNEKIGIHIPSGAPLTIESVTASLDKSKEKIKRYFGIEDMPYVCSSWLLSPELDEILPEKSNIRDFRALFDIKEGKENIPSILSSVFHTSEDTEFSHLSENTSLQRSIKATLSEGKKYHNGVGTLNYFEGK